MENLNQINEGPYLRFLIQPKGFHRFRYHSEKTTHGCIQGCLPKSYPTVELVNYKGKARLVCTLVEYSPPHGPHIHILDTELNNIEVYPNHYVVRWPDMAITYKKQKEAVREICEESGNNDLKKKQKDAKRILKEMKVNVVRLKVTAFELNSDKIICDVISEPIKNDKSSETNELKIVRISKVKGIVQGKDEVYILCAKVVKEDIKVVFYETDMSGRRVWEKEAEIDLIHKQCSMVIRTPSYHDPQISENKKVWVELVRPSDDHRCQPREFEYKADMAFACRKRKRTGASTSTNFTSDDSSSPWHYCGTENPFDFNENDQNLLADALESKYLRQEIDPIMSEPFNRLTLECTNGEIMDVGEIFNSREKSELIEQALNECAPSEEYKEFCLDSNYLTSLYSRVENEFTENLKISADKLTTDGARNHKVERLIEAKNQAKTKAFNRCVMVGNDLESRSTKKQANAKTELSSGQFSKSDSARIKQIFSGLKNKKADANDLDLLMTIKSKDDGNTLLHLSIIKDKWSTMEYLAQLCLKWDKCDLLNYCNDEGESLLHLAIKYDRPQYVKLLLRCGADPIVSDKDGNNAIHLAIRLGRYIDEILAEPGAIWAINQTDNEGKTPLHLACVAGQLDLAEKLIEAGANEDKIWTTSNAACIKTMESLREKRNKQLPNLTTECEIKAEMDIKEEIENDDYYTAMSNEKIKKSHR